MAKTKRESNTLAGIKLPKALRQGGFLTALLDSPLGRQMLADALIAAAGAAAAVLAQHGSAASQGADKGGRRSPGKSGDVMRAAMQGATGAVTNALGTAARSLLDAHLPVATGPKDRAPSPRKKAARKSQPRSARKELPAPRD